jgi:hypothetical protein
LLTIPTIGSCGRASLLTRPSAGAGEGIGFEIKAVACDPACCLAVNYSKKCVKILSKIHPQHHISFENLMDRAGQLHITKMKYAFFQF